MATTPRTPYKIELNSFKGCDFANVETAVDAARSPYAPNIVADAAGVPEVRPGYETIKHFESRINGIYSCINTLVIHVGASLYIADGEDWKKLITVNDARSAGFNMNGKLYVLTGAEYIEVDIAAKTAKHVEGYVPTTLIGCAPAGGGTDLEAFNMLTPWNKQSFIGDGTTKEYKLTLPTGTKASAETPTVEVDATPTTAFTYDAEKATVTFSAAPPDGEGVDNVVIKFALSNYVERQKVEKCTICTQYGIGNDSRIFISGNPEHRNIDWQSGLYDPTYFPDTGYTKIGGDSSAIMGYLKQYDSLVIVKERQAGESSIFLRTAELDEEGTAKFPVREGVAGVGGLSKYAFASAAGDQTFLSTAGVVGLDTNAITQQKSIQLRSWYVNPTLMEEEHLDEAVMETYGRYMVLAVNGHMYVANTELTNANMTGSYGYEWYYWTDIPARVLCEADGRLYIGREDGKLCRLKTVREDGMTAYSDDGKAITAMWTTPLLTGGDWLRFKTISKKGTGIMAKPMAKASGTIFFTTNKTIRQATKDFTMNIFDWDDVDFNAFTFNVFDNPQVEVSPKKFRKVLQFQMGVQHDKVNEGMGLLAMMISYTIGSRKRR